MHHVEVRPEDLQTFAAFQRAAAGQLALWVRHDSERASDDRQQAAEWADEVERAWRAGS
jgi:hypothetical protein